MCLIPRDLPYLDWNRVWLVPFYHAFYYGVVEDFMDLIFPKQGAYSSAKVYEQQPADSTVPHMLMFPEALQTSPALRAIFEERIRNMVRRDRLHPPRVAETTSKLAFSHSMS